MNYGFIESLKEKYRVTELQHAFRINGVVDIYKQGNTVYEIVKNQYHKQLPEAKLQSLVNSILLSTPEREDFKKVKGAMSYQEFKNIKFRERTDVNALRAEDHHWNEKADETSEDHLYFAVIEDKVKIGRSKNPLTRIKTLETGLYQKPKVYVFNNKGFMETKLHHIFSELRLNGEWFRFDLRIQYFLEKHHTHKNGYTLTPKKTKPAKSKM